MNKEKIYIVSWNGITDSGGVERVTYYMANAWKDTYDVELIDFAVMRKKVFYRLLLGRHYVIDAIATSIYTNRVLHRYKENNVKVVTQGFNAPYVNADLHISHGTMRGYKLAVMNESRWHFNQRFEQEAARRAKKIIAVGNHVKKEQITLYGTKESKLIVVENCVDTSCFQPIDLKRTENIVTILFVGRLEFRKGMNRVIELAECLEKREDARLIIATNSNENIDLFHRFRNTEIKVGLNRNEMNDLYNSGDIMFFPSLYEGFELVTIEALSVGVPVIGNAIGAIADLYGRGQKGIEILRKDMNENIDIIIKMAGQYRDYKARLELHKDMAAKYSLNVYFDKLRNLWD